MDKVQSLILQNVSVRKGEFVVGPISAEFPPQTVVAIAGASGSGKTLLLRAINGLESLEGGSVKLGPTDLSDMPVEARRIGFVFQEAMLFPKMNVKENLTFPLKMKKIREPGRRERLNQIIEELDIDRSYLEKYEAQLPAGIQRLTAIGKERMRMLDLLIMDEPMCHLDAHLRGEIRGLVRSIVHQLGKTTLLALNEPEDIMAICDYVVILKEGQMVESGPVQQVYSHPKDMAGLEALSNLGVNRLQVRVKNGRTSPFGLSAEGHSDGNYWLCFRPQDTSIGGPEDIPITELSRRVYDGNRDLITARIPNLENASEQGSATAGTGSLREEIENEASLVLRRDKASANYIRLNRYYLFPI